MSGTKKVYMQLTVHVILHVPDEYDNEDIRELYDDAEVELHIPNPDVVVEDEILQDYRILDVK